MQTTNTNAAIDRQRLSNAVEVLTEVVDEACGSRGSVAPLVHSIFLVFCHRDFI